MAAPRGFPCGCPQLLMYGPKKLYKCLQFVCITVKIDIGVRSLIASTTLEECLVMPDKCAGPRRVRQGGVGGSSLQHWHFTVC